MVRLGVPHVQQAAYPNGDEHASIRSAAREAEAAAAVAIRRAESAMAKEVRVRVRVMVRVRVRVRVSSGPRGQTGGPAPRRLAVAAAHHLGSHAVVRAADRREQPRTC